MHLLCGTFAAYQRKKTKQDGNTFKLRALKTVWTRFKAVFPMCARFQSGSRRNSLHYARRFDHRIGRSVVTVTVICALMWPRQERLSLSFPPRVSCCQQVLRRFPEKTNPVLPISIKPPREFFALVCRHIRWPYLKPLGSSLMKM